MIATGNVRYLYHATSVATLVATTLNAAAVQCTFWVHTHLANTHMWREFAVGAKAEAETEAEDGGNLMLWHATPKAMPKTKQQQHQLTLQWQELAT